MLLSGDIVDEQRDIADWRDYYFDPIKKLVILKGTGENVNAFSQVILGTGDCR